MSDKEFEPIVRVLRTSVPGRAADAVDAALARAWNASAIVRAGHGIARRVADEPPAARIRATGLFIAVAVATLEIGVALIPPATRPAPPRGLALIAIGFATSLIVL